MLISTLQVVLALGLLNVWLLRSLKPTRYRGGDSVTLKQEFSAYGLPTWFFYLVGTLKIGSALMLLLGFWFPALIQPAALTILGLMVGALAMHIRVKDPLLRSVPALSMLIMCTVLVTLNLTG
ncbi:MAG: DoxX family protein [Planctomycetota bacterium]|jgi:uncharacterized membrane protein YphA (DoxX/SURF4 family)|nr:DoxX family protein [Planctomycetota bacterium]MDG2144265.1 DoxX family protein [Planctomycetota bacterium]